MKWICPKVLAVICMAWCLPAAAQQPNGAPPADAARVSPAMAAMRQAAAANKYTLVFFWKEKNAATDAAWGVFQGFTAKMADWAEGVAVRLDDPAEKALVDRFDAARAPMPLVLAVAANGAVTRAFTGKLDEAQLRTAFVSPCTEQCLKALQERKLVVLCVQKARSAAGVWAAPPGVREFATDARFARFTQVVALDVDDQTEAGFLRQLQVDARPAAPVTVLLAPPGSVLGKFEGSVTKEQLVAKVASAQSGPCAGGQCGPNGCGPKR